MLLDPRAPLMALKPVFSDEADFRLLNDFQRDFPLMTRPFARIAADLGVTEAGVLSRLNSLREGGTVSRVGPVFSPRRIGASTLAALKAPPAHLEETAAVVSAHPEINHNYAREHEWNLWFVVAAPDAVALARVLREIRRETGCPVIALPLREEYHIDLGFDLAGKGRTTSKVSYGPVVPEVLTGTEVAVMQALQSGLPLVSRPFASVGNSAGVSESEVLSTVRDWISRGIIKRFGVVVRHHELGYRANAMCVWDVPDDQANALGELLAAADGVNLCYRRARAEGWPFNLYCMIHGHDQAEVRAQLAKIVAQCGLADFPSEVLFSTQRFKQCGARYVAERATDD